MIGQGWKATLAAAWLATAAAALAMGPVPLHAADPVWWGSRQDRQKAVQRIPWSGLSEAARAKLQRVVRRPTLYRRMPAETIECDRDLYIYLVRHPEVVVQMWRRMGVTQCRVQRTGRHTFRAHDGAGTTSRVELVYGTPHVHVFFAEGSYSGRLVRRPITGRSVLVLHARYGGTPNSPRVTSHLDVFVKLDDSAAEVVARTLAPLVGRTADQNFSRSLAFVSQVSKAARNRPDRLQRLGMQLTGLQPDVRDGFLKVAAAVGRGKPGPAGAEPRPAVGLRLAQ